MVEFFNPLAGLLFLLCRVVGRLFHYKSSRRNVVLLLHNCLPPLLVFVWKLCPSDPPYGSSTIPYLLFPSFCLSDFCSFFCEISSLPSFNPSTKFLSFQILFCTLQGLFLVFFLFCEVPSPSRTGALSFPI